MWLHEDRARYSRARLLRATVSLLLEDEHCEVPVDERLLWTTREDYRREAWHMQLGLYRAPPDVQFILTENGLGLREGATTPKLEGSKTYFTSTLSFPNTPKLVIVLRSTLLSQEADIRAGVRVSPEQARRFTYTTRAFSRVFFFHDLPRTQAKRIHIPPLSSAETSWLGKHYSDMSAEDQRKHDDYHNHCLLGGKPLASRLRDRFVFAIDDLTADQADRINVLRLTHCRETICFVSPKCLLQAIEAFEGDRLLSIDGK
ncbi:hypothetical protein FOMPIDRAFT_1047306 [Fomitopsis schrenkii]|uniref:Uncharacterized protein n=1 Tax=Fomitopsis schrenkii TaxID=2126942 RepID=S8FXE5_FOMSC|nr:hypothetical protein FOMPIDRAFT_1047306 [Fomitopsis schrenkii]